MRDITAKPAPRRRARASEDVIAGRRDNQKTIRSRTKNQPGEIVVYDGRDCTGWLTPKGNGWLAYLSTGKFVGSFASDRLAAAAVYEAAKRPGGAR